MTDADIPTPRCGQCGGPFLPDQPGQKYCSARCREAFKKRRQRFKLRHGKDAAELLAPLGTGVTDESLSEMHEQAGPREDPRDFSDYGELPDDLEVAAAIDAQDARIHAMLQADQERRTPRQTWRKWRQYGRRHGTEHPEQTADRVTRSRVKAVARMARIDRAAGRIQDRFDSRTASNVADNASQSRKLNARHVEQPPQLFTAGYDFQGESVDGDFYRSGRGSGNRPKHADYAWRQDDGFRF